MKLELDWDWLGSKVRFCRIMPAAACQSECADYRSNSARMLADKQVGAQLGPLGWLMVYSGSSSSVSVLPPEDAVILSFSGVSCRTMVRLLLVADGAKNKSS